MRGLKLLRKPCFFYLQTIIAFQYRYSVGQRHTFHIIHVIETTVLHILPDIWDDGKNRLTIINLFKLSDNSLRYFTVLLFIYFMRTKKAPKFKAVYVLYILDIQWLLRVETCLPPLFWQLCTTCTTFSIYFLVNYPVYFSTIHVVIALHSLYKPF